MISETIPAALDGERLDRVVALVLAVSRSDAAALVAAGGALIDGAVSTTGKVRLIEGQVVSIDPGCLPQVGGPEANADVRFDVVYEDADLLVIDKPAGLVVHPAAGHQHDTLVNGLLARYPEIATVGDPARPGIVHRLDVGTSGVMMVARSQAAYELLVQALAERRVERTYRALVWGHPANAVGVVEAPIGRDPRDPMRMAIIADGRPARTRFRVVRTYHERVDVAELRCRLETGRTHQIRVHLAAIGHPVVGDGQYGGVRTGIDAARPWLHAEALGLRHPLTGAWLAFEAELPDDLVAILAGLGPAVAALHSGDDSAPE